MDDLDKRHPGIDYYDREGKPISTYQYMTLHRWGKNPEDPSYIRVATDTVNGYMVSTVWLGLNHNYSQVGPPLIFETMVFGRDGRATDLYCDRYSTEEEALEGHKEAVAFVSLIEEALSGVDHEGNELPSLEE